MAAPCPHSRVRVGDRVPDRPEQPWLQRGSLMKGWGMNLPGQTPGPAQRSLLGHQDPVQTPQ